MLLSQFLVFAFIKEHCHAGGLDALCHVYYLFKARHAQRYVFRADSREVECVQSHLRGRLSDGLRSDAADHLAWVHTGTVEPLFDFSEQSVETFLAESLMQDYLLRVQESPQVNSKQSSGVELCLL